MIKNVSRISVLFLMLSMTVLWRPGMFPGVLSPQAAGFSAKQVNKTLTGARSGRKYTALGGYKLSSKAKKKLKKAVRGIEKGGRNVSFCMIDLRTMKGISYNAGKTYYSASSVKGPYVVSLVAKKPSVLKKKKSVIRSILKYSDNDAYIALVRRYGFSCLNEWAKKSGAKIRRSGGNRCYAFYSAKNLAKIWVSNYEFFQSSKTGKSLGKMFESPNLSAIRSVLGGKYRTRSKAGWIAEGGSQCVTNDGGIVYSKKGPYVVVILSSVPSNMGRLNPLVRALEYVHNDMVR